MSQMSPLRLPVSTTRSPASRWILRPLGDKKRLSRFLFEGGYAHIFAAQAEPGQDLLHRARALGEESGDDLAVAYAEFGAHVAPAQLGHTR